MENQSRLVDAARAVLARHHYGTGELVFLGAGEQSACYGVPGSRSCSASTTQRRRPT